MLKDKINKIFKGDGDSKKKIENLVFLLVVLVITIIAINFVWSDDNKESENDNINYNKQLAKEENSLLGPSQDELEIKLEDILSKINGVGQVDVMINYTESTQIIPIYNKTEKNSTTDESDSGGGTRKIQESDINQEVVYQEENGKNVIATQKKVSPKIEGAIITAQGANNPNIKNSIIQAVEAVTGLATHKIQVFEKQN